MFYRKILILIILIKFRVKCDKEEDRASVKFLLSDAKDPQFNLGEFRQKKIIEDDNVAAESIILPTLNMESHPYAVVVLPDLNKFAAKTFKKGRLTLEDIISGSIGLKSKKEVEVKEQNPSSSDEPTETEIDGISLPAIPVLSVVKSDGEIIDLNQNFNSEISTTSKEIFDEEFDLNQDLNSEISAIPDEEFEGEIIDANENLNQTSTDENSPNYDYEFINTEPPAEDIEIKISNKPVDNEKSNMVPANSIATIKNLKNNLETILSSRSIPDQDTSGEVSSAEKTDNLRKTPSSNERYKISAASLEKKSRVTFKGGFPLKFSSIISTSKGSKDIKSLETFKGALVSKINVAPKNKTLLPTTILKVQSIQTLPIVNEFSSLRNSQSSDQFDPQDPNSATKNQFLTLGKARELRPIPVEENNLQEISNNKKDSLLEAISGNDDIEHSKQNKKSIGSNPSDYVKLVSESREHSDKTEAKSIPENNVFNSNLYLGSDTLSNAFEFVRAIGIPLSTTEKSKEEETSQSLPQKEKSSSSEQREQISQLIKLRKQLMLLDTSSFATENVGRSNSQVNPENVIGSYQVEDSKNVEFNTQPLNSNISGEKFANETVDSPSYSNEPQIIYPKPILGKENKDSTLTWGKFLKKNSAENENDKLNNSNQTPPPPPPPPIKENVKFNRLESIKAPIKENYNLHTRHQTNQNEEKGVIFEKFDISNAISSTSASKYSITNNNESNNNNNNNNKNNNNNNYNEQVSYNLPELSIDDLNSYESQEQNRDILQRGSEPLPQLHKRPIVEKPTILSSQEPNILSSQEPTVLSSREPTTFISQEPPALPSPNNYFTNTLQSSLPDYYIKGGCDKKREKCIDTTTRKSEVKLYTATPTIVDYSSQTLIPSFESIPTSTASTYPHNQVEARSISSFTDFTVTNPVHRASIEPGHLASTPYLIHNVLSLKTVTQYATVTVMTPSIVIHTHTEVIEQTRYVTISKTIAAEPLYTSTILHVMPDPKTVTLSVAASTVTSTVNFAPTVTHTLYSTVCSNSLEDLSEAREYNNYGIDTETLMGVPSNFHLRSSEFKKSLNSDGDGDEFDEVYWPKTDSKRDAWPEGFDAEKFEPSSEFIGTYDNHLPDSEAQESGSIMSVVKPDGTYMHRNRQRMSRSSEFEDSSLVYGIPYYGYRPIDNDFPMYKSPGNGNSIKNKV